MKSDQIYDAELAVDVVKRDYGFGEVQGLLVPKGRAFVPGKVTYAAGLTPGRRYNVGVVENPRLAGAVGRERKNMAPYMVAKVYGQIDPLLGARDGEAIRDFLEENGIASTSEVAEALEVDEREVMGKLMGWWNKGLHVSRCPISDGPSTPPRGVFWVLKETPVEDILD